MKSVFKITLVSTLLSMIELLNMEPATILPLINANNDQSAPLKRAPQIKYASFKSATPSSLQTVDEREQTRVGSYRNLKKGSTFNSEKWRINGREHYYKYTVLDIIKVKGVYDNILNSYYSKELLISGAYDLSIDDDISYKVTTEEAISFNWYASVEEAVSISAQFNIRDVTLAASLTVKTGTSFSYSNTVTYSTAETVNGSSHLELGKEQAEQFCPDGYDMAIGHYGEYYVLSLAREEHDIWWWGDYKTDDSDKGKVFTAVDSDERNLTLGFIFKHGANHIGPSFC